MSCGERLTLYLFSCLNLPHPMQEFCGLAGYNCLIYFTSPHATSQPDADLRERLNLINGLQEVRAASLKRVSSVTEMPLCPIKILVVSKSHGVAW